jgi:colanic acid/amylovoran biosynthesis glycosyltransferase
MRRLPFSFSAHAKDIWTTPGWEKREKLRDAAWTVTCTRTNAEHLRGLAPGAAVELIYHGLDAARFGPPPDARDPVPTILCVARAVEKKGLDVLVEALARLPAGLPWRFEHIGGGELARKLKARAAELGIADRIAWHGAQAQDAVLAAYRRASLFCLPARIAVDGDRDGLPNVIMEAMSQELPVLSTPVSAIPEIVVDGETGLLLPPDDPAALAAALERLLRDPGLRARLGRAGRARVVERFGMERGIDRIAARLRGQADPQPDPSEAPACASPSTLR